VRKTAILLVALFLVGCPPSEPEEAPVPPVVSVAHEPVELTDLAKEALALAPDWLQDDLAISLQSLDDEDLQNEYAALITDVDDHYWIDEIAFTIAHTSPEVLNSTYFHPELLLVNVEHLYARDADLPYVQLDDVGEPGVDADYYTTATYQVATYDEESGIETVASQTIEKEIYYWYVVHPRGEDERPYFIDPDGVNSYPQPPDEGFLWREWLWTADRDDCPDGVGDCPVLADLLTGQEVLWKRRYGNSDDNGAMGQIIQWVNGVMHFGALDERSVQPVRIYALHHGNCGEHGDMTNAAVRIGLIPGIVIEARGNDHCWSEFYDGGWMNESGWVQVEPVNNAIDYYGYYADGEGNYRRTLNGLDDDCDGDADESNDDNDSDGDGVSITEGDCHDGDAAIFPGAVEVNNARDDNCDGVADEGFDAAETDADGDGYTVADGDCHELDATTFPGAEDAAAAELDGRDNDCDGIADDGLNEDDADGDGFSIAAGDCDDGNGNLHPDAVEINDGRDNDCDGVTDPDMLAAAIDRDGDLWTVTGGDCDDTRGGTNPSAEDPKPSTNRLFGLTGGRGDALVLNRTEDYVKTFTFEVIVTDEDGIPVDGALVWILGWSTTYAQATGWWPVTEMVTGADGVASMELGYANEYAIRVDSNIGGYPANENSIIPVIEEWPEAGDVVTHELTLPYAMPQGAGYDGEVDLGDTEADFALSVTTTIDAYRVAQTSRMLHDSFSLEKEGGFVDVFVVDQWGYERFDDDRDFVAAHFEARSAGGEASVEISNDREWYVVVANTSLTASTVIGDLAIELEALGETPFDAPVTLSSPFRVGPGQHIAFHVARPVQE
jgi:hypothetical protein